MSSTPPDDHERRALGGMYAAYFAALGVTGPFVASLLEARGLSPARVAYVLSMLPLVRTVASPGWTLLADRIGSSATVLRVVSLGSVLAFAAAALRHPAGMVVAALVALTVFRAPCTAL